MSHEEAYQQIESELATAQHAQSIGNEGMARVCARRAVGIALRFWLQTHTQQRWNADAMNQLRSLSLDDSFPQHVRDAATRLTTRITANFTSPFSTNPLDDANLVISYLMEEK